jgi:Zn finger protein HypA/HybF involved in hydrogenase expression
MASGEDRLDGGGRAAADAVRFAAMRLWCVECGRPSGPEAKGWRLYRADDEDEVEVTVLTPYCPACAVREFGVPSERGES